MVLLALLLVLVLVLLLPPLARPHRQGLVPHRYLYRVLPLLLHILRQGRNRLWLHLRGGDGGRAVLLLLAERYLLRRRDWLGMLMRVLVLMMSTKKRWGMGGTLRVRRSSGRRRRRWVLSYPHPLRRREPAGPAATSPGAAPHS